LNAASANRFRYGDAPKETAVDIKTVSDVQYQLMSQSGWYHDKAANCERMALASVDTAIRARHIKDRDNWLEIAARIDAAEEAVKSRKI